MGRPPFAPHNAIVTGGASGIGPELARALVARGTRVVVAAIDPDAWTAWSTTQASC